MAGGEGATGNEMVGCHHRLNEHVFEQTPGDSEGQGSLVCCILNNKDNPFMNFLWLILSES